MKKFLSLGVLSSAILLGSGCAIHSSSSETGHDIAEASIKNIHDGRSTLVQILNDYGAPSKTSRAGPNDLYIYHHCISGGTAVVIVTAGDTSKKEHCESLTVAVNRESGIVTSHNFKDELDD